MIYMTTDEWHEISKLLEAKDFDKLLTEICIKTYDLNISEKELDGIIKDYAIKMLNSQLFQGKTWKGYNTLSITTKCLRSKENEKIH